MFYSYFYKTEDNGWAIGNAQIDFEVRDMNDVLKIEKILADQMIEAGVKVDNLKLINFQKFF